MRRPPAPGWDFARHQGVLRQVGPGVHAYVQPDGSWFISNAGIVTDGAQTLMVDTCSTERRTRAFLNAVEQLKVGRVRMLVNTHHHGDHTNGNCLLPDAVVVGHRACRDAIARTPIGVRSESFSPVDWGALVSRPPEVTFERRLDVHVGDLEVSCHHLGWTAHTPGDVIVWVASTRTLFVGDLVFNGATPFTLMGSLQGSFDALDSLRAFDAEVIVPGHGPVGSPSMLDDVEAYLRWLRSYAEQTVDSGMSTLQAARAAADGPFAHLPESERLVGNLRQAWAELRGEALTEDDVAAAFSDMVVLNGGHPLACSA